MMFKMSNNGKTESSRHLGERSMLILTSRAFNPSCGAVRAIGLLVLHVCNSLLLQINCSITAHSRCFYQSQRGDVFTLVVSS